jgi:hypothetical protein
MERDIKEVIGVLMRILDGGEVSRAEVEDLAFEATGDLQAAVNNAYNELLEFADDYDARQSDRQLDGEMRSRLQKSLNNIVQLSDLALASDRV